MSAGTLLDRVLAGVGSGTYLARLGCFVESVGAGEAFARLRARETNANRAGMVHGGATASLLMFAAELAAASTERERHADRLRISTLSVSFVDAIRATAELRASGRVVRRGRDIIHLAAEARSVDGDLAAHALLVYGLVSANEMRRPGVRSRIAFPAQTSAERLPASPYMQSAGAAVLEGDRQWSCMALPLAPNQTGAGQVHDGAIVGLVDTCAAVAAFKSGCEHAGGPSATVSLSMAWAGTAETEVRAGARVIGRSGSRVISEVEVCDADGLLFATGQVCYRIFDASA